MGWDLLVALHHPTSPTVRQRGMKWPRRTRCRSAGSPADQEAPHWPSLLAGPTHAKGNPSLQLSGPEGLWCPKDPWPSKGLCFAPVDRSRPLACPPGYVW